MKALSSVLGSALLASCATITPADQPGMATPAAATFSWPAKLNGKTILFVGAHPDDEWGVAPLLADACLVRGAKCHFVVAADANSPGCFITMGLRDLGECSRIRREEMNTSARMFNGTVEFFGFDDLFYSHNGLGVERVIDKWSKTAGGREPLVQRFEQVILKQKPALIFTFDPRHGSTCNPDHRAVSLLLVEAVRRLPVHRRPPIWLEQSDNISSRSAEVAAVNKAGGFIAWPDTSASTVTYDAAQRLKTGKQGFDYVRDVRRVHVSQYPDEASGKATLDPPVQRRLVSLAPGTSLTDDDYCNGLNLQYPTLDLPEVRKRFGLE